VLLFAATLFLSSLLMFALEPIVAKTVLPILGGTPMVWNTCVLFFQILLLGGYAYAHGVTNWLGPRLSGAAYAPSSYSRSRRCRSALVPRSSRRPTATPSAGCSSSS
jgi:hypothetical protein